MNPHPKAERNLGVSRRSSILLWLLALLIMACTAVYQRRTGPTVPLRGTVAIAGLSHPYTFLRSESSATDARVALPNLGAAMSCALVFRRHNSDDAFQSVPLRPEEREGRGELAAYIPRQPAAGKVAYHLEVLSPDGMKRIPERGEILIRFKDPVPAALLVPHILFMFLAMLAGLRTGMAALVEPSRMRSLALFTLGALSLGGLVLGPFVQHCAFHHWWTGWPNGGDLTDNKTLIMWLGWLLACAILFLRAPGPVLRRWAVGLAALAMLTVYLIPHSLRGSELDHRTARAEQKAP